MKRIEKQLKKEIEDFELNQNILAEVKEQCNISETNPKSTSKTWYFSLVPVFATVILLFTLCFSLIKKPNETLDMNTYISVSCLSVVSQAQNESVNPVIEIVLDENNQILKERGLNNAGVIVLAGKKTNMPALENTLETIVIQLKKLGFLESSALDITAVNSSKEKEKIVEGDLKNTLEKIIERNLIVVDFQVNALEGENQYGINPNFYDLILKVQSKFGGKIEDYLDEDFDDLLEMLYEYDETTIKNLEKELEAEIEKIESQYEAELEKYENLEDKCEILLEEFEDLIKLYEDEDSSAQEKYFAIISKLSTFFDEFDEFFLDFDISTLTEVLKPDAISDFYNYFEMKSDEIEELAENLEDEIEEKIASLKKDLLNY